MPESRLPAVSIAAGVLFVLLMVPLLFRETRRARALDRRLGALREEGVPVGGPQRSARRSGGDLVRRFVLALLRAGSMLVPVGAGEREKLSRLLRKSGFARPEALSVFLSCKLGCAVALGLGAVFGIYGSGLLGGNLFVVTLGGLGGLVLGGVVPEYVLRALAARRTKRVMSALPDALDMMVMCLESGLTVERAMTTVAEGLSQIEPGVAREFRQIEAELRLGSDRRAVLGEYYRRTEIDGMRDFAMSLIQADRYGTPLSQSMRNIAADARVQKAARIQAQAERLPVLMTLPMLLLVMPGTMLLVAGPAFLSAINALKSLGNTGG